MIERQAALAKFPDSRIVKDGAVVSVAHEDATKEAAEAKVDGQ